MARDYRLHDYNYIQLLELQPPQHYYNVNQTDQSSSSAYELTAVGGGGASSGPCEPPGANLVPPHQPTPHHLQQQHQHQHHHHDPRKRKNSHFSEQFAMSGCEASLQVPGTPVQHIQSSASATRKRKASSYGTASAYDDDGEDVRSVRTLPDKKQNHSEIEKRRRDKMNTYISELSAMVPMCGAMSRKLDKLTVLRMAVQHLRSVRGALSACPLTARPRPAFVSERELNELILQAAHDSFLIVVGCDRGRLLYVSASVKKMLHYDQSELLGQSMFDLLHPKDVAKVKEQLSSSDLSPRERLIDAKTMLPVKADVLAGASRLCPGARRSFFCRIKCKALPEQEDVTSHVVKEDPEPTAKLRKKQNEKKYCVVQCTGYLKSWAPAEMSEGGTTPEGGEESEACNISCLVAVGRALPDLAPQTYPNPASAPATRNLQYVSRHAIDGKYLFVDQRVTLALGFLPQELLGTSLYEYVNGPELGAVARTHKAALVRRDPLLTPPYSFRRKDGTLALLQTHFKPFRNPWTKDVECLVANNTVVTESQALSSGDYAQAAFDVFKQKGDAEMQQLIDSQVESQKIGSAIAEEVLRRSSSEFSPDLPADLLQDAVFNEQASLVDNILGVDMAAYQVGQLHKLVEYQLNDAVVWQDQAYTPQEMVLVNPAEILAIKQSEPERKTTLKLDKTKLNTAFEDMRQEEQRNIIEDKVIVEDSRAFTYNLGLVKIKTDPLLSSANPIQGLIAYTNAYKNLVTSRSLSSCDSPTTPSEAASLSSVTSTTLSNFTPCNNANHGKPLHARVPKVVIIKKIFPNTLKSLTDSPLHQLNKLNTNFYLPSKHKMCSFPGNEKVLTVLLTVFRLPFSVTPTDESDEAIIDTNTSPLVDDNANIVYINLDLKDRQFVRDDLTGDVLRKSWFVVQRRRRVIISSRSHKTMDTYANSLTWYAELDCGKHSECEQCALPTSSLVINRPVEEFYIKGFRIHFSKNTIHTGRKSYRLASNYKTESENVFASKNTSIKILNPKTIQITKKIKEKSVSKKKE